MDSVIYIVVAVLIVAVIPKASGLSWLLLLKPRSPYVRGTRSAAAVAAVHVVVGLAGWAAGSTQLPIFAEPIRIANVNAGALSTVAGDFNNDGRAEFVSAASRDSTQAHFRIYTYEPSSQGFLTFNVITPAAATARKDRFGGDLDVADMNNDGFADIVVPDSNNGNGAGRVSWFENPGGNLGGTWIEHEIGIWTGTTGDSVEHMAEVAVGDLNGDGWNDVVTRDVSHGCYIFLRNPAGTGWLPRRLLTMNPREGLTLWNPDGDGDLDILVNGVWFETPADPLGGTYLQHPLAAGWYPATVTANTIADYACQVGTGDFNGDGRSDLAITNSEELNNDSSTDSKPKGIRVYLAPLDPVNGTWTQVILDPLNFSWHSLEIGDVDLDGDIDVVSGISQVGADNAPAKIVSFLNDGSGTAFTPHTIDIGKDNFNADVFVYNATLADADGDGSLDLLAPDNWNSGPIRYYKNLVEAAATGLPAAPVGLTAILTSATRIDLEWSDQSNNETGFRIERSVNSSAFVQIAQTGVNATSFSDPGLAVGTEYVYRVRAFNVIGNSAYTLVASAATPADLTPPVLTSVSCALDGTVTAVFNEPVEYGSAANAANYSLGGGASVTAGSLATDGITVTLATSGLVDGNTYTLTATGVADLSVARNPSNTTAVFVYKAWLSQDIGAVAAAGSIVSQNPTVTLTGSGADIFGAADEFRFAYRPIVGDVTIVAQVVSQTRASPYSKAGVMIRETLAAGSKHASMTITPDFGGELNSRPTTSGATGSVVYNPAINPQVDTPYWVRIVRQGSLLTGSVSVDGVQWQSAGTATVSMASQVYLGLAVTSHLDGALSTARFENVNVTPANDWISWRNQHFTTAEQTAGLAAASADPDSDHRSNLTEYALGSNPRQFSAPLATTVDQFGLSLTFTRPFGLPGISYGAETSDDLLIWTPAPLELLTTGTTETLRARAPLGTGDPSRGFLRLRFVGP